MLSPHIQTWLCLPGQWYRNPLWSHFGKYIPIWIFYIWSPKFQRNKFFHWQLGEMRLWGGVTCPRSTVTEQSLGLGHPDTQHSVFLAPAVFQRYGSSVFDFSRYLGMKLWNTDRRGSSSGEWAKCGSYSSVIYWKSQKSTSWGSNEWGPMFGALLKFSKPILHIFV